jgi:hypothetical protein
LETLLASENGESYEMKTRTGSIAEKVFVIEQRATLFGCAWQQTVALGKGANS